MFRVLLFLFSHGLRSIWTWLISSCLFIIFLRFELGSLYTVWTSLLIPHTRDWQSRPWRNCRPTSYSTLLHLLHDLSYLRRGWSFFLNCSQSTSVNVGGRFMCSTSTQNPWPSFARSLRCSTVRNCVLSTGGLLSVPVVADWSFSSLRHEFCTRRYPVSYICWSEDLVCQCSELDGELAARYDIISFAFYVCFGLLIFICIKLLWKLMKRIASKMSIIKLNNNSGLRLMFILVLNILGSFL